MELCRACQILTVVDTSLASSLQGDWTCLRRLNDLWRRHIELCAKDPIPKATGDTKAILVISKVMGKVVFLQ